jgi:hypothetical protein
MEPSNLIASILVTQRQTGVARSAFPDAPVVPHPPPKPRRVRALTARVLYRLADTVSPRVTAAGGRPTLAGREGSALIRWDESPCRPSPTTSA